MKKFPVEFLRMIGFGLQSNGSGLLAHVELFDVINARIELLQEYPRLRKMQEMMKKDYDLDGNELILIQSMLPGLQQARESLEELEKRIPALREMLVGLQEDLKAKQEKEKEQE